MYVPYMYFNVYDKQVHIKFCLKVPLNLTFCKYLQQIKLSILPSCSSCQPLKFISIFSTNVLVIIIKTEEKNETGKMVFSEFQT